ncbi:DUF2264 domain-containing protein [Paludibacter sp.]
MFKKNIYIALFCVILIQTNTAAVSKTNSVFQLQNPDYKLSPLTGMTRQHWFDAAEYILAGAFSYITSLDDPMVFPKQHDKTYPRNEGQVPTEKLEGLCRTLFVAAPLLKNNPELVLNNIKVADYYRHNIINLVTPDHPSFIKKRSPQGGPSQILVEFGALAISLSLIPEVLWEPLTPEQKEALSSTMLSYGEGPTINSNWRFFNIFVLSFFKEQGYSINEKYLRENLEKALAFYRGEGWYNDAPAYDYYSMWAFQTYGPLWSELFGKNEYSEYAKRFMDNLKDMTNNYPYMFSKDGKMNMWGRSISYRFGSVLPLAWLGYFNDVNINYGWMRRISSSTMLQFLTHPEFLQDNVPTLGFYGPFEHAVQIYSCRGSVFWGGKAFLALFLPEDNPFWTSKENNGPWEKELKTNHVYNKFQPATNLMITNYPNSGAAEMRSWCYESVAKDWQKFRSSENYNKLAYNTEFPWMADGKNGEISMNYGVLNSKNEWEVLRLYTFKSFENDIYRRDAILETNNDIRFQLADITLPNGILRVDKVKVPSKTKIRLGHYSLPEMNKSISEEIQKIYKKEARIIDNGYFKLVLVPIEGWQECKVLYPEGLHPVSKQCAVPMSMQEVDEEAIFITLHLWKKGNKKFSKKELNPISSYSISSDKKNVNIIFADKSVKTIYLE